ncbi:transposase [Mesorhizobium newzealandense]|uniref:Transposase n=1 Tax=Mesorhizobium newzealandense TaxID=1300302 RepID=A0ABW4UF89_9HYPH
MDRTDLQRLTKEELIDLVLRIQRPEKTSRTSSRPPSSDRKARRDRAKPGGAKAGHKGHSRAMSEDADRIIDHHPDQCLCCRASLSSDLAAETVSEHDKIELPAIRPLIERHRRLAVRCPSCGTLVVAAVPDAAKGTPFGPRVHAVATYLKTFQALSYERLQGAFAAECDKAVAALRRAKVIASDETGVRIEGSNAYHWVFRCAEAVVHQAAPTRGAVVVRTLMDGHRPDVWCSDRYAAQQGHANAHQTCLAHLARDVAYADEASEDMLPSRLKRWLQRAFALADGMETFAASTIAGKRRALERSLDDIFATTTSCDLARDIQNKFRRARDQLLTFAQWPGMVDATNNACERALRPAVVQRKITNGYRAMWAAQGEADIRTVVDTARLAPGTNSFKIILQTVSA